jgi:predicted O-methyltransferase YrrM
MLDRLEKGMTICEVGTEAGNFALEIVSRCQPKMLHAIDVDLSLLPQSLLESPNFTAHKGLSQQILAAFPDELFDFIYIDADHGYEAVCNDIEHAVPKLKPGGILAFNDFALIGRWGFGVFGVQKAVSEFAVRSGWPVVYFCLHVQALYDVALRRPPS